MKRLMFFIIGLVLSVIAEYWRFNIVLKTQAPWIPLIIGYILFLVIAYFSSKFIKNDLLFYIIFALLGLMAEVFLLAQLPLILAAGVLGLISWLSFWGTIVLIPRLYLKGDLKKFTIIFFVCSLLFFSYIQLSTNNPGSMGLFYSSLNIPYIYHFIKNRKKKK